VKHYPDMGVNLYNPGTHIKVSELREATCNRLTILGSVPPRDVLAAGTPDDIRKSVDDQLADSPDPSRLILSCAGGMPPGVSTGNIMAMVDRK
jgi:uroporphyrinogen decarboxylase